MTTDSKPWDATDWTVDDLEHLPDDGRRYELLDGRLLVSPSPVKKHQRAVLELASALRAACPPDLEVFVAPFDWQPERTTSFEPDVLIIRRDDPNEKNVTEPLVLAVEVLSPSTRKRDLGPKRAKYEAKGVGSYWVVDPERPSVLAWDLVDGQFRTAGEAIGEDALEVSRPFPVRVVPETLVAARSSRSWTVDDLAELPDDGRRYELLDGRLLVSPAPVVKHQVVVRQLFRTLDAACPPGLDVFFAPIDWQPERTTSFQPDVLVTRGVDLEAANISSGLLLAVEVLSPSTRRRDLVEKRAKYESAGVASYWVVDPDALSIEAWDLVDGRYQAAGQALGDQELQLERPFPVTLTPSTLLPGYPR